MGSLRDIHPSSLGCKQRPASIHDSMSQADKNMKDHEARFLLKQSTRALWVEKTWLKANPRLVRGSTVAGYGLQKWSLGWANHDIILTLKAFWTGLGSIWMPSPCWWHPTEKSYKTFSQICQGDDQNLRCCGRQGKNWSLVLLSAESPQVKPCRTNK